MEKKVLLSRSISFENLLDLFNEYSPAEFIHKRKNFEIIVRIQNSFMKASLGDIYRISERNSESFVHYKEKNEKTGRVVYRKFGPVDKNYLDLFILPFFEHGLFCNKVAVVINLANLCLNNQRSGLAPLLEDLEKHKTEKIQCIRDQNFREAAGCRDAEKKIWDKIKDCLKKIAPRCKDDEIFNKAFNYFLDHYQELLKINGPIDQAG